MAEVSRIGSRDADQLYRIYSGLDPFPVQSTNVAAVAYDVGLHLLFIKYKSGGLYCYEVPATVFTGLATAASKGKYVYDVIRGGDGRRPNRRLDLDHKYNWMRIE